MEFITHKVASRRLKTVVAIPWAEPAPAAPVPYTAFVLEKANFNSGLGRKLQVLPELDRFAPPTAPITYPAFVLEKANFNSGLGRKLQVLPELDRFARSPTVLPALLLNQALNRRGTRYVNLEVLTLNGALAPTPPPHVLPVVSDMCSTYGIASKIL